MTVSASPVLQLKDATDPSLCGQKAAALAHLLNSRELVPAGIVVTSAAFQGMDENALRTEMALALKHMRGPFAIRSSAVAEDLHDASFAGQYLTLLDVPGPDAVFEAVRRCLASASTARVKAYAKAHNVELTK